MKGNAMLRLPLVVLLSLARSACSTISGWFEVDDDTDLTAPVELVDIETSVKVRKLWSVGVGNGQGEGLYKIQPAISGDIIYAAAADGEVVAVDRTNGRTQWDVELETGLAGGVAGMQYNQPAPQSPWQTALGTAMGVGGLFGKIYG